MKNTWLYKRLECLQENAAITDDKFKSGFLTNILNIFIVPIIGLCITFSGLLSFLLLPLYLIKDLYDLHCYINREKIAKKEAIKKALEFKNKVKNWIDTYQTGLNNITPYKLQKIIYEEKPKVEQLPGVNCGYLGNWEREIYIEIPRSSFRYNSYNYNKQHNIKKELLSKEFITSSHSKFEDFILVFFKKYNNECNTLNIHGRHICDTNRRRSLHDIYLITKYYYPEVTFIDIIKTILSLLKIGIICGSYCSTVNKYVFYTISISNHNNFESILEYTNKITFNDLKKYIENEQ